MRTSDGNPLRLRIRACKDGDRGNERVWLRLAPARSDRERKSRCSARNDGALAHLLYPILVGRRRSRRSYARTRRRGSSHVHRDGHKPPARVDIPPLERGKVIVKRGVCHVRRKRGRGCKCNIGALVGDAEVIRCIRRKRARCSNASHLHDRRKPLRYLVLVGIAVRHCVIRPRRPILLGSVREILLSSITVNAVEW